MTARARALVFLAAVCGLVALLLWGLAGLPAFGSYHGPYGVVVDRLTEPRTHATGVVSAVNFFFRGFDTLGEEFILFAAATGVAMVLRELRKDREPAATEIASHLEVPATSEAVRTSVLALTGPVVVLGWWLTTHAQTDPSGGFQGGAVVASAFMLVYLGGQYLSFRRISPIQVNDAIEAAGAAGFAMVGFGGLMAGAAYLSDVLPLGKHLGAVDSSGTIVLISCFVGIEVAAGFLLIVSELLDQTLLVPAGERS